MDLHRALRILALQGVVRDRDRDSSEPPSADFQRRKIFRWYSEKFSTPLHLVDELPIEDILTHYYESSYAEMSEDDLAAEIAEMTATPEERRAAADKRNLDALGTWEMERQVDEEGDLDTAFAKAKGLQVPEKKLRVAGTARLPFTSAPARPGAEVQLPDAVEAVGEKLQMTFISLEELERLSQDDGLGSIEPLPGPED